MCTTIYTLFDEVSASGLASQKVPVCISIIIIAFIKIGIGVALAALVVVVDYN